MQPDVLSSQESASVVKAALALDKQGAKVVDVMAAARAYKEKHGTLAGWQVGVPVSLYSTLQQIDQKAQRERIEALKAHGIQPQHLRPAEHASVYVDGLNAIATGASPNVSAGLRKASKAKKNPEKWCATIARRDTSKLNAAVLADQKEHPVMQAIESHDVTTQVMHLGTIAGSLRSVRKQYTTAQRLARLEQQNAAMELRMSILESGSHWHDVAVRMRAAGDGPSLIAKATGQQLNTVRQFLKRNR